VHPHCPSSSLELVAQVRSVVLLQLEPVQLRQAALVGMMELMMKQSWWQERSLGRKVLSALLEQLFVESRQAPWRR
jgi:hypothetical protein